MGRCGLALEPGEKGRAGLVGSGGNLPIQTRASQSGPGAPSCCSLSNQGTAQPPAPPAGHSTRGRPRPGWATCCLGYRGATQPLRVTGAPLRAAPWSAPCTGCPWAAGGPGRTCPSISPPSVSARPTARAGLGLPLSPPTPLGRFAREPVLFGGVSPSLAPFLWWLTRRDSEHPTRPL